jgi:hypothetical protein
MEGIGVGFGKIEGTAVFPERCKNLKGFTAGVVDGRRLEEQGAVETAGVDAGFLKGFEQEFVVSDSRRFVAAIPEDGSRSGLGDQLSKDGQGVAAAKDEDVPELSELILEVVEGMVQPPSGSGTGKPVAFDCVVENVDGDDGGGTVQGGKQG